jgi:hypothetical protein
LAQAFLIPITNVILGAQERTDSMVGGGGDTPGGLNGDLQLQMSVGADGLVSQVSVSFRQQGHRLSRRRRHLHVERHLQPAWQQAADRSVPPIRPMFSPEPCVPERHRRTPRRNTHPERPITSADRLDYLKAAACMRSHGIPDFPDPTFGHNTATFNNANPNSPEQRAPRRSASS